jgi:shikimate kinase / 3-dehydroquinate synthase
MIVLIGFMGAGKSTVGRALAPKLGLPFVDTDDLIEAETGSAIAELFVAEGERRFREIEREIVVRTLGGSDAVIALGGGAVTDPVTCTALEWTDVVYLTAPYAESMRRTGADPGRPLLTATDPRALYRKRQVIYERVADVVIDTHGRSPDEIADEIAREVAKVEVDAAVDRVVCAPPSGTYPIVIGQGIASELARHINLPPHAEQAFVITHPGLDDAARKVAASLADAGLRVAFEKIPEGERSKSLDVCMQLYSELAKANAHRGDLIVAVGGGVVTDVAGYVAATFNRGMPIVNVPTTFLGQVDAAIGGKTGVNLDAGKNLVGAIHQPVGVICDVEFLSSLPEREIRGGLAEVVKYGFIADPGLLDSVGDGSRFVDRDRAALRQVVTRSVGIKAEIVASDERDEGPREALNYGHTFAHAIEHVLGYGSISHGEAVGLGMMAAAHLAHALKMIDEEVVEVHRRVISGVGLPITADLDLGSLQAAWERDKKYRGGVRFVLLEAIGRVRLGVNASDVDLKWAIERMRG